MNTTPLHTLDQWPLVSIALCTYNGEKFLQQQIDSLLGQTYPNIEIVAVDDASTDNTLAILEENSKKDKRFRYFINEKNLGYNKNFEKVCQLTTGEFIAISDQDDIWDLQKIQIMMNGWNRQSLLFYSLSREFHGDKPLWGEENKPIVYYEGSMPEKLPFDCPIHGHSLIFQRSLLQAAIPFPAEMFYDLWLALVSSSTGSVQCIKQTLTHHRMWSGNSSRTLTSIKEKTERSEKLRSQGIHHLEEFLKRSFARPETRALLEQYVSLLRKKKDNRFSWAFFTFFLKNRKVTFHYKKHRNIFSITKNSFKRAFVGM